MSVRAGVVSRSAVEVNKISPKYWPAESMTPGHMESGDEAGQGQASGQEGTSFLPAGYESQNMTVIETIVGGERVLTPVPRAPDTEADDR